MDFTVFENLPFDVFIWRSTIARLGVVLDFHKSEVRFVVEGKKTIPALKPDHERGKDCGDDIPREDFTSSSSEEER